MSLLVRLVPTLGDPNEILQEGLAERGELVFDSDRNEGDFVVGRGPLTGIVDSAVQSEAFQLSFDATCFAEHQVKASLRQDSNLFLNGFPWDNVQPHVYLSHGDVVSLDGLRYEYKINIEARDLSRSKSDSPRTKKQRLEPKVVKNDDTKVIEKEGEASSPSKRSVPVAGIAIPHEHANRLGEEIQCSVCLDIQVHPRTLHPCGHSFCGSCLQHLDQCPQCRKKIESHSPAIQLDSLICTLVSIPSLLEKEDVDHYHERKSSTPKTVCINLWRCYCLDNVATANLMTQRRCTCTQNAGISKLQSSRRRNTRQPRPDSNLRRAQVGRLETSVAPPSFDQWVQVWNPPNRDFRVMPPPVPPVASRSASRNRNRAGATQENAIFID